MLIVQGPPASFAASLSSDGRRGPVSRHAAGGKHKGQAVQAQGGDESRQVGDVVDEEGAGHGAQPQPDELRYVQLVHGLAPLVGLVGVAYVGH
jgi:hypothetical protein